MKAVDKRPETFPLFRSKDMHFVNINVVRGTIVAVGKVEGEVTQREPLQVLSPPEFFCNGHLGVLEYSLIVMKLFLVLSQDVGKIPPYWRVELLPLIAWFGDGYHYPPVPYGVDGSKGIVGLTLMCYNVSGADYRINLFR